MSICDWLDFDSICRHDCESCLYKKAKGNTLHCNHEVVTWLLDCESEADRERFFIWLEAQPLGKYQWLLSCNNQGRKRGRKDESNGIWKAEG